MIEHSVTQVAEAIRTGQYTALEYAEALIGRVNRCASLNAFVIFDADRLRNEAQSVDEQIADGIDVGPLAGVPITIKDNIETAGLQTTAGTAALRGFVPQTNATVLQALLDAGALLAGKTNMHELGHMPSGRNPTYGHVRNPYDLNRTSGGSSAGTAATVAASVFPAGLGSDTGGSCRIPAALCGCVGFRPTTGRYSQDGLIMLSRTHDTIGLLARSVSDIELLDSICSGDEPRRNGVALAGTRIGIPGNFYSSLDTDLAEVVTRALDVLRNSGVILVEADIRNVRELASRASVILSYEIPRELEEFLHDLAFIFVPTTLAPAALVASNPVPSASNTYLSSLAGLPCLNIPISLTHSTRLPVGMEIVGLNGDDQMILSLGRSIALALGDIQPPDPS